MAAIQQILLTPQAYGARQPPRFALVVLINDPQAGKNNGGAVPRRSTVPSGGVLRSTMNIEPDALATGESEFVINQGGGTGGRS